jgi:peptidoglycan hydrolase-like protein with peptidoglycan-binding domain
VSDEPTKDLGLLGLGKRRWALATVGVVAVVALLAGVLLSNLVISPGEAAARASPPEPSLITAEVESRALHSTVVTRGDVVHGEAMEVEVAVAGLEIPPIVTGQLPAVGDRLDSGDVALEVAGRPVIVLRGDLPTYRSLEPGSAGPDVQQLKAALTELGLDPGDPDDDRYTAATAEAVGALYEQVGYAAPAVPREVHELREAAREGVELAEESLQGAQQALDAARRGPSEADRLSADASVAGAKRALEQAKKPDEDGQVDEAAVAAAEEQLAIAKAYRAEGLAAPDTSAEAAAVAAARVQLEAAREHLAEAESAARTRLPAAEVVFVAETPVEVAEVLVERGEEVEGPVLQVTSTGLVISASLTAGDAALVEDGAAVRIEVDDDEHPGTVTNRDEAEDGIVELDIAPDDEEAGLLVALRGRNVRIVIPVEATDGEVLAVPLAALTAGPTGESRVQVEREDGAVDLVTVEVGLAAGGFAEVAPLDGELEPGDRVVVGR